MLEDIYWYSHQQIGKFMRGHQAETIIDFLRFLKDLVNLSVVAIEYLVEDVNVSFFVEN